MNIEQAQHMAREPCSETRCGIKQHIKEKGWKGKPLHRAVGIDAEQGFGKEFAGDDNDNGGYYRLKQQLDGRGAVKRRQDSLVQEVGHEYTIDNNHYIVADKQTRDKIVAVAVKFIENAGGNRFVAHVYLHKELVGGDERYFHSGEESGEDYDDYKGDYGCCHYLSSMM
jgi:hypothetical protein